MSGKAVRPAEAPEAPEVFALWLDDYLPYRAAVAANEIAKAMTPHYQRFGLTLSELAVLSALHERPALTQQMIVARTVLEKFTVSRAVKSLVRRGLAERSDHENDRRSHWLSLTPAGRRLFARVVPMSLAYEKKLAEALGGAESAEAIKALLQQVQEAARSISPEIDELLAPYAE